MQFDVLGAFRTVAEGRTVALALAPKPHQVLMVLLAQAGRPVTMDVLLDAVWGEGPPPSARRNVQLYVHRLRSVVGSDLIHTGHLSYTFMDADAVDAVRFDSLARSGVAALAAGDVVQAHELLRTAIDLWRGPAFDGFQDCGFLADEAARLEQQRLDVIDRWAETALHLGRYQDVVGELPDLVRQYPFRERLAAHLMAALQSASRSAEALEVFHATRVILRQQLGIEPGSLLQRVQRSVLQGEGFAGGIA